ncbi:MAG TPA: hypothetical protein PLN69_04925 [bacterium]|nr:hypothetical protein [bacterium]
MILKTDTLSPDGMTGRWIEDSFGLPAYEYTCDQDLEPAASVFTTCGNSNLHWHQLGNDRLNAIATNRGDIRIIESSRGLQWLNFYDRERLCPGAGIAVVDDGEIMWADLYSGGCVRDGYRRIFGCGYFRKIKKHNGLRIDHRIIFPFGDDPVCVAEMTISNMTGPARWVSAYEFFGINLHFMSATGVYMNRHRAHFGHSAVEKRLTGILRTAGLMNLLDVDKKRTAFSRGFEYKLEETGDDVFIVAPVYTARRKPGMHCRADRNYYPEPMFMAALDCDCDGVYRDARSMFDNDLNLRKKPAERFGRKAYVKYPCLCAGSMFELEPGEEKKLSFIFGYSPRDDSLRLTEKYRKPVSRGVDFMELNSRGWKSASPVFSITGSDDDAWAGRETRWHAYYTQSALLYDEYFENHYLPQGSAYEYLHGLRGAVRDIALFLSGYIYINPGRSAEILEYLFRTMAPGGRLMYAVHGYGRATGMMAHEKPSDLQLFLLWALTEYVFFTGDYAFLDRQVPFFPKSAGTGSIREKVIESLNYLVNEIGLGEHGLIRVGDGDWSDGISLFTNNRRRFVADGESMFNSAMALYVLPRVAALLAESEPGVAESLRTLHAGLKKSVLDSFNGKWFPRAYDGEGKPIGDRELFLDHHTWLLISRELPPHMAKSVIDNIHNRLDRPSSFGQYVLHPPQKILFNTYAPGWDVNGGVWFAMNYLLSWGYGYYDRALAWNAFRKNSMAMKATLDPAIWYGIWSGPDSFNADYAPRPRETYFHLPTPMTDFPVMNLNWHACYLGALMKLCGIEPGPDGISPAPLLPFDTFSIGMPTFELNVHKNIPGFKLLVP